MIDVSQYNGIISWDKVVADSVIIRAGYRGYSAGVIKQDAWLSENLAGVIRYNIPFGLYFMSQAINESEAEAEALFCLDLVKGMKLYLPIFYDCEYSGKAGNTLGSISPWILVARARSLSVTAMEFVLSAKSTP